MFASYGCAGLTKERLKTDRWRHITVSRIRKRPDESVRTSTMRHYTYYLATIWFNPCCRICYQQWFRTLWSIGEKKYAPPFRWPSAFFSRGLVARPTFAPESLRSGMAALLWPPLASGLVERSGASALGSWRRIIYSGAPNIAKSLIISVTLTGDSSWTLVQVGHNSMVASIWPDGLEAPAVSGSRLNTAKLTHQMMNP